MTSKEIDMNRLIRKEVPHATGGALTASVATFAAAVAFPLSGPAIVASQDYRFELA